MVMDADTDLPRSYGPYGDSRHSAEDTEKAAL